MGPMLTKLGPILSDIVRSRPKLCRFRPTSHGIGQTCADSDQHRRISAKVVPKSTNIIDRNGAEFGQHRAMSTNIVSMLDQHRPRPTNILGRSQGENRIDGRPQRGSDMGTGLEQYRRRPKLGGGVGWRGFQRARSCILAPRDPADPRCDGRDFREADSCPNSTGLGLVSTKIGPDSATLRRCP